MPIESLINCRLVLVVILGGIRDRYGKVKNAI